MKSGSDVESDIGVRIQKTLISINDFTIKIKKELDMIEKLVQKNGQLHKAVDVANETLSKKVQEKGINVAKIINESKRRLEPDPSLLTSIAITEKLLEQMDA